MRNIVIGLLVFYLALFGLTKAIRYPEPIAAIKLGLAPASKTPDLMPGHWIKSNANPSMAWSVANSETPTVVTWDGEKISFDEFLSKTNTNAFIIIRNGEITFEKYLNGKRLNLKMVLQDEYDLKKELSNLNPDHIEETSNIMLEQTESLLSYNNCFKITYEDIFIRKDYNKLIEYLGIDEPKHLDLFNPKNKYGK